MTISKSQTMRPAEIELIEAVNEHTEQIANNTEQIANNTEQIANNTEQIASKPDSFNAEEPIVYEDNVIKLDVAINKGTGTNSIISNNLSNTASGPYSHAEGNGTTASGTYSHAEGNGTTASKAYAHAEGQKTTASSACAHAEGSGTQALSDYSHAEGLYTIARATHQHVSGSYNIADTVSAEIVGNGTSNTNRSNAYTLSKTGTAWYAGDVTCDTTQGDHSNLYSMRSIGAVVASTPTMTYGTSNAISVSAGSHTLVDVTFPSTLTEVPVVFPAIQCTTAGVNVIATVQSVSNTQASICVTNLGTTDVSNITVDYLALSGR